ncbi:hypothetical protein IEQ34_024582 [Dendrobium chrysotoxum]|uniref:Cytochrome c biogenesis FC n=1 Tax=Dendrobium chrysotoxum TaxID=161865 RepID=A0AAV7FT34_DENCH|nr:hypothetical protein IEQ34_024582 [Dendrobium chrysotoxum]
MVQLLNFFFFITSMVVPRGTAAPVLFQLFVSRDVPTGAPSSNGTLIPILIPEFPFLVYLHSRKFIRSMDRAKSGVLVRASRPILFTDIIGRSSSARNALFQSFCGLSCLQFFRTIFSLPRDRSAKRERRRKRQTLRPNGNEQRRNDKMRCPGYPYIERERRVEGFGPVAFPVPPSSSGACLGGVPPEIGLEALALPTSRLLMAVGHDYYKKVKIHLPISHVGVCIFLLGVLLSCDPVADVRPVAHASYFFRAGGSSGLTAPQLSPVFGPSCMRQKLVPRTVRRPSLTPAVMVRLRSTNTNKIQFTQRLPLGPELHMGKERCCLRGLDHLHGPTFHSICGNFLLSKPSPTSDRFMFEHDESLRADLLPILSPASYENGKLEHFLHRWMKNNEHKNFWFTMSQKKDTFFPFEKRRARLKWLYIQIYLRIYMLRLELEVPELAAGFLLASSGGSRSLLRQLQKDKLHWNRESSMEFLIA